MTKVVLNNGDSNSEKYHKENHRDDQAQDDGENHNAEETLSDLR